MRDEAGQGRQSASASTIIGAVIIAATLVAIAVSAYQRREAVTRNAVHLQVLRELAVLPAQKASLFLQTAAPAPISSLGPLAAQVQAEGFCVLAGNLYLRSGDPLRSVAVLQRCIRDPLAPFLLSFALTALGETDAAQQALGQVAGISRYLYSTGTTAHESGKRTEAAVLLAQALMQDQALTQAQGRELTPYERSVAFQYLVQDLSDLGRVDDAILWAQRWLEAEPDAHLASIMLGGLYLQAGDTDSALRVLMDAAAHGARSHYLFSGTLGQVYEARGETELAITEFRSYWQASESSDWAHPYAGWYLGRLLWTVGRTEEARPYLEFVLEAGPEHLKAAASNLLAQ